MRRDWQSTAHLTESERARLIEIEWENDVASLRVFMATLRKKLDKNTDGAQYIQTHVGIGYRMTRIE